MKLAREKPLSLLLLAGIVLSVAVALWPETSITSVDRNDNISHFTLIQGMARAVEQGRNPLDFWSPETVFGYPEIRVYQPLAHAIVVAVYFALGKTVSLMTIFVWVRYLSLVLLPITFYATARLLGFSCLTASITAAIGPLPSAAAVYGLEWSSYIWRGYGLFPQEVAMHFWLLTTGLGFQAVRRGKYLVLTGVLLGMTALAELMYGYMAAAGLCLMALIPDAETPRASRLLRTVLVGVVSVLISLFQLLGPLMDRAIMDRSPFEPSWKWDSWGAGQVLTWLLKGQLMDFSRLPVLSLLALAGVVTIVWEARRTKRLDANRKFLLYATIFWILLFFGRPFWGPLLLLVGVPPDMHLHRVVAAVQLCLILLASLGLARVCGEAARRWGSLAAALAAGLLLAPPMAERANYIAESNAGGERNLAVFAGLQNDITRVLASLETRGGRAYPGLISSWGSYLTAGAVPMYLVLTQNGIPTVSYLAHSLALPGDLVLDFNELKPSHYRLFNIQSVLAPAQYRQLIPKMLTERLASGPFVVFDAPGNGYFDVVDAPAAARVNKETFYTINKAWMRSDWPDHKAHLWLDLFASAPSGLPQVSSASRLPDIPLPASDPGQVTSQKQDGDAYEAEVQLSRPSFVLFKMTWHPNWKMLVDGAATPTVMLSPGFLAVPVTPGHHRIWCRYEPGTWKLPVGLAGLFCVLLLGAAERLGYLPGAQKDDSTVPAEPATPALKPASVSAGRAPVKPRKRRASVK